MAKSARSDERRVNQFQRNVKVQNGILKSEALNWFQGKVQDDILVMPN